MKRLTRAQVLSAKDIVVEDVPTPEWAPEGSTADEAKEFAVGIRNLTGAGRGVFIQSSLEMKAKEEKKEKVDFEIEMLLVAMTAVDENNERIFTEEDVKSLGERNAAPVSRCAAVASRLSGLDKEAANAAGKP